MTEFVQVNHMLTVETGGKGFYDITAEVAHWLETFGADSGLVTVFVCHTSASLTIQENADPNVRLDLLVALDGLAPEDRPYAHQEEGADDMPSHIKSMLTGVSLHVPVHGGAPALGTWQGIYLVEHRARSHRREVMLQFVGSRAG
jgi:secondary thiamine-phosphate synthase enzyme